MNQALLSRRLAVVAIVLTVGVVAAGAAAGLPGMGDGDQPSGDDILEQAETRYDAAETIAGTAEVTVSNDTDSTTATVEYAAKAPDKVAYTVSKNGDTYEAGSNGSVAWAVGPDRAYARDLPTEGELDEYRQPTEPVPETNVTATLVETTELDGESVYVVETTPTAESATDATATLWIATDDSRVLKMQATDGTNETVVRVTETQFDVSIHNSTFEPPTDRVSVTTTESYERFDAVQSATELSLPDYESGEFSNATLVSRANGQAVFQQYDTASGPVSVITADGAAQYLDRLESNTTVTVDGQSATAVTRDGRATVVWTTDGTTTAVAVTGTVADAQAAANGL